MLVAPAYCSIKKFRNVVIMYLINLHMKTNNAVQLIVPTVLSQENNAHTPFGIFYGMSPTVVILLLINTDLIFLIYFPLYH